MEFHSFSFKQMRIWKCRLENGGHFASTGNLKSALTSTDQPNNLGRHFNVYPMGPQTHSFGT